MCAHLSMNGLMSVCAYMCTYPCMFVYAGFFMHVCLGNVQLHMTVISSHTHIHTHAQCSKSLLCFLLRKQDSVQSIDCESSGEVNALWHSLKDMVQSAAL